MPYKNIEDKRAHHNNYIKNRLLNDPEYRKKHYEIVSKRREKNNIIITELFTLFRSDGCKVCKENEECCLDAHHLDSNNKDFNLGDAKRKGYSITRIKTELEKCICICANCHRKLHAGKLAI